MKKQKPVLIAKSFKDIKKGLHFKRIKDGALKLSEQIEIARRNPRPEYPSGQPFMEERGPEIIQLNGDGSKEFITIDTRENLIDGRITRQVIR